MYYAPSDPSRKDGMRCERIHSQPSWHQGPARHDCVFVNTDPSLDGMRGLEVVRIRLFFSFSFRGTDFPCALVSWYSRIGDEPDEDTGMWHVEPQLSAAGQPAISILHLDCLVRAAHLIGMYGKDAIPRNMTSQDSLDAFRSYYVNKYIDYHAFEIAA